MTSKEYLKELQDELKTLPVDEQNEALDYYAQYFEDALAAAQGAESKTEEELVQNIMTDLGTPVQLAAEIKSTFASVPATTGKRFDYQKKEKRPHGFEEDENYFQGRKAYAENARVAQGPFIVRSDNVQTLELEFNMAEVVIIPSKGDEITAEGRGPRGFTLEFEVEDGALRIKNTLKEARMFFRKRKGFPIGMNTPRVLIELPENLTLDSFIMDMNAGSIRAQDISVQTTRFAVALNAGDAKISGITSTRKTKLDCNAGNISVKGSFRGKSLLDCNAGNISLETTGSVREYSLTEDINMGSVTVNGEKHKAFADDYTSGEKENDILADVNCGKIDIKIG